MKNDSQDIIKYRSFIRKFWLDKIRSDKFGIIYNLLGRVVRRLIGETIQDPAHKGDCSPVKVPKGYQPAYHYFRLKLK